jgi:hypothetical protein
MSAALSVTRSTFRYPVQRLAQITKGRDRSQAFSGGAEPRQPGADSSGRPGARSPWLGEVLPEPAELVADDLVVVPPAAHDLGPKVPEPVAGEGGRSPLAFVLDLPCLLVDEVRTPQAQVDLRVAPKMHHPLRGVPQVATPALNVPIVVYVYGGDRRVGAHDSQCAGLNGCTGSPSSRTD